MYMYIYIRVYIYIYIIYIHNINTYMILYNSIYIIILAHHSLYQQQNYWQAGTKKFTL